MTILNVNDTVNGGMGYVQTVIDGNVETLFHIKNVDAAIEKNKESLPVAGSHWEHSKLKSIKGTGSGTMYYMTSTFRKLAKKLADEGKDFEFDMIINNMDPSSTVGAQTVMLKRVNMDAVTIAKFDTDSAALEEDFDFTFMGFDLLSEFQKPSYY